MTNTVRIRRVAGVTTAGIMLVLLPMSAMSAGQAGSDKSESQVQKGFAISPIQPPDLQLAGKNRALVGLGSYIVNTTGCNDCHTWPNYAPGHDPFLNQPEEVNVDGYMAGGRPFGPLLSANITPDGNGLPAHLTFSQFLETLRTGHNPLDKDPPGSPPLQVMPWPVFGKKTDNDLLAIYVYLSSIPCREGEPPSATTTRCQ